MSKPDTLNTEYEAVPIDAIEAHPRNPNRGDLDAIAESIEANGFYGALVVQRSTRRILAGNHRWQAARAAGLPEVPVVWVDVDDERALRILLADNRTAELSYRDPEELANLLAELESTDEVLLGTGYQPEDIEDLLAELDPTSPMDEWAEGQRQKYTDALKTPIYEPSGIERAPADLYDASKAEQLRADIDAARAAGEIPEEVAEFLDHAAARHVRFSYEAIADFYASAPPETQRLMEASALVIIDFDAALENGFVRLTEELERLVELEQEELEDGHDT